MSRKKLKRQGNQKNCEETAKQTDGQINRQSNNHTTLYYNIIRYQKSGSLFFPYNTFLNEIIGGCVNTQRP